MAFEYTIFQLKIRVCKTLQLELFLQIPLWKHLERQQIKLFLLLLLLWLSLINEKNFTRISIAWEYKCYILRLIMQVQQGLKRLSKSEPLISLYGNDKQRIFKSSFCLPFCYFHIVLSTHHTWFQEVNLICFCSSFLRLTFKSNIS